MFFGTARFLFMLLSTVVFLANLALAAGKHRREDDPRFKCFERHIRDAITLNYERLPKYSALTSGASEKISKELIYYENLSLFAAYVFDWRASSYQERGIPVLCDEFVSISSVPAFVPNSPTLETQAPLKDLDVSLLEESIRKAYKDANFQGVVDFLGPYLIDLEKHDPHHCMVRHVLESILRTARLAPGYREAALAKGLSSTDALSWDFMSAQLFSLSLSKKFDQKAFEIQKHGIPIVCNDVPKID